MLAITSRKPKTGVINDQSFASNEVNKSIVAFLIVRSWHLPIETCWHQCVQESTISQLLWTKFHVQEESSGCPNDELLASKVQSPVEWSFQNISDNNNDENNNDSNNNNNNNNNNNDDSNNNNNNNNNNDDSNNNNNNNNDDNNNNNNNNNTESTTSEDVDTSHRLKTIIHLNIQRIPNYDSMMDVPDNR